MKNKILSLAALGLLSFGHTADFKLESNEIIPGQSLSNDYFWNNFGCSGKNQMPELHWSSAPQGTKSFALTFYDQDAPTGSGFWHYVAYDIPADVKGMSGGVAGGALPAGAVLGNTDLGQTSFFGPCPPAGRKHNYVYTVHALKVDKLPVPVGASPALVGFYLWMNGLGKAELKVTAGPR